MTVTEKARAAGFASIDEVAVMVGRHRTTIINWHKHDPSFLEIVLIGCVMKKAEERLNIST